MKRNWQYPCAIIDRFKTCLYVYKYMHANTNTNNNNNMYKDLPSLSYLSLAYVFDTFSLPAKSTRLSLEDISILSLSIVSIFLNSIVKLVCALLEV